MPPPNPPLEELEREKEKGDDGRVRGAGPPISVPPPPRHRTGASGRNTGMCALITTSFSLSPSLSLFLLPSFGPSQRAPGHKSSIVMSSHMRATAVGVLASLPPAPSPFPPPSSSLARVESPSFSGGSGGAPALRTGIGGGGVVPAERRRSATSEVCPLCVCYVYTLFSFVSCYCCLF